MFVLYFSGDAKSVFVFLLIRQADLREREQQQKQVRAPYILGIHQSIDNPVARR
jgi:hypothetical protein